MREEAPRRERSRVRRASRISGRVFFNVFPQLFAWFVDLIITPIVHLQNSPLSLVILFLGIRGRADYLLVRSSVALAFIPFPVLLRSVLGAQYLNRLAVA